MFEVTILEAFLHGHLGLLELWHQEVKEIGRGLDPNIYLGVTLPMN